MCRPVRLVWSLLLALAGLLGLAALAGCDSDASYKKREGQWTFNDSFMAPADPKTFKPIDRDFARDKLRGYYRGLVIDGSDGASFEVLSTNEARDRNAVYYAETYRKVQEFWAYKRQRVSVVDGADPASYKVLANGYAKDTGHAYYEGKAIKIRDVASFEPLNARFARDKLRGYYERIEIPGSDGASFVVIDEREADHARDKQRVYHALLDVNTEPNEPARPVVRVLQGANPATVRVLGRGYAIDGNRVWWRGVPVAGADAASFVMIEDFSSESDARDAKGNFREGRRVAMP